MKQTKHFTFTELLLTCGVVLTAGALMIPALSGAAAQGRSASCAESLKKLGEAHAAYAKDNNDLWVKTRSSLTERIDKNWAYWTYTLLTGKYVDIESLICPTAEAKSTDPWSQGQFASLRRAAAAGNNKGDGGIYSVSYGYNYDGLGGGEGGVGKRPNYSKSGRVIVAADSWDYNNFKIKRMCGSAFLPCRYNRRHAVFNPIHDGKVSVLWSDGSSTQETVESPTEGWDNEPFSEESNWFVK